MGKKDQPPPGPPPSYNPSQEAPEIIRGSSSGGRHVGFAGGRSGFSMNPFRRNQQPNASLQGQPPSEAPPQYEAPPGPPQKWYEKKQPQQQPSESSTGDAYAAPPGPPPSKSAYGAPPGPPPSKSSYDAPPGPPPSKSGGDEPPPYDPWLAVPDNALLPPPPALKEHFSPTANASQADDDRALAWLSRNPLWTPRRLDNVSQNRKVSGDIVLSNPPIPVPNVTISHHRTGRTRVKTSGRCEDTILLSNLPMYSALTDNPNDTEQPYTLYFELHITVMGTPNRPGDAGIAIGFLAPPYPAWRLPGWHRASLGVHGDDGHRYVDNAYGGQAFTQPFRAGQVVGIGMKFTPALQVGGKARCEVFFTRNGAREGGWDLGEERDRDDEGSTEGLWGDRDLLGAVGAFGGCEFEVRMNRQDWKYQPG